MFTRELSLSEQKAIICTGLLSELLPPPGSRVTVPQVLRREQHFREDLKNETAWVQMPAQTFIECVTRGIEPQFKLW